MTAQPSVGKYSMLSPRKVLLVAARNVTGERNGRIAVLETAARALQNQEHMVTVLAITSEPGPDQWLGLPVHRLSPPGLLPLAARTAWNVLRGGSLNESVFDSAAIRRQIVHITQDLGTEVVLADGIRIWPLLRSLDLPVIMHLDDLLSDRYQDPSFISGNKSILGYFSKQLPATAVPALERMVRPLIAVEAGRLRRRETAVARQAHFTALTSHTEADTLSERSGARVHGIPMAVDPRQPADPAGAPANRAVFLGALYYGPNMAALRFLLDEVLPLLRQRGHALHIDVIGAANEAQRAELCEYRQVTVHGYVDDLTDALHGHRMFLSPITAGTGVKTKVLDGMSVGLPVVATSRGVAGIPVTSGRDALVADTPSVSLITSRPSSPSRRQLNASGRPAETS